MLNVWCCFIVLLTFLFSLPQKLLASGVQIESDPEEVDDEVMVYVFVLDLPS